MPLWPPYRRSSTVTDNPANEAPYRLINGVEFGDGVIVQAFTNLYGCRDRRRHPRGGPSSRSSAARSIGARCKIQSHTFICTGVEVADEVFVGHGVVFINDKRPRATTD